MEDKRKFMLEALRLAGRGKGNVEPNPMVGALVIKEGKVVGRGFHQVFGGPHAEVNALQDAGSEASRGSTLYVTLEPCAHFGKTPPCTEAIIAAGVDHVVAAVLDPNPLVRGKGVEALAKMGVKVEVGICEEEARLLNAPYFKLHEIGIPYFIAKWAMTLDGKIATASGESKWITGEEARQESRRFRAEVEAVMVGVNTIRRDDPLLTTRGAGARNPHRIVVDSNLSITLEANVVRTTGEGEVIIATTNRHDHEKAQALERKGVKVLVLPAKDEKVDLIELAKALGRIPVSTVLIEGGGVLLGSALDERLIDEVKVFIAPKLLGGQSAKTPIAGFGIQEVTRALKLERVKVRMLGEDILVEGYVESSSHSRRDDLPERDRVSGSGD